MEPLFKQSEDSMSLAAGKKKEMVFSFSHKLEEILRAASNNVTGFKHLTSKRTCSYFCPGPKKKIQTKNPKKQSRH